MKGDYDAIIDAISQAYSNTLIYIQSSVFMVLLIYHFLYNNLVPNNKQKVALTAKHRKVHFITLPIFQNKYLTFLHDFVTSVAHGD